eukprot:910990-Prorocentrum_minimum.AAC.2
MRPSCLPSPLPRAPLRASDGVPQAGRDGPPRHEPRDADPGDAAGVPLGVPLLLPLLLAHRGRGRRAPPPRVAAAPPRGGGLSQSWKGREYSRRGHQSWKGRENIPFFAPPPRVAAAPPRGGGLSQSWKGREYSRRGHQSWKGREYTLLRADASRGRCAASW